MAPSERKDIISDKSPEELIVSTDLEDEERFEAISLELANKNARRILREIVRGYNTSSLIAERTGLTIQDVIAHLGRLENIGLIETAGLDTSSLRGRSARRYRVSKVAVLLIPSQPEDEPRLREQLEQKSAMLVKKRLLMSIFAMFAWGFIFISLMIESEVQQHYRAITPPPNSNITSTPQTPLEIIAHFSVETWALILVLTLASSAGIFIISRIFARKIIN